VAGVPPNLLLHHLSRLAGYNIDFLVEEIRFGNHSRVQVVIRTLVGDWPTAAPTKKNANRTITAQFVAIVHITLPLLCGN